MVRALILIIALIATPTFAMDGGKWVNDWWTNQYPQQVEQENKRRIEHEQLRKCKKKLRKYRKRIRQYPDSVYYKYKLEKWQTRCSEE